MFRKKFKDANVLLRLGLSIFVIANAFALLVHPSARLGTAWLEGVKGFLYGFSIVMLLWSIRLRTRKCGGSQSA